MNWENYSSLDLPVVTNYDGRYVHLSLEELNELCLKKDPIALYEKGNRLRVGKEMKKDIEQAMQCYEQVLKVQKNIGAIYYMGRICLEDLQSADCEKYFRLGSSLGDAYCSYEIGEMYRYGNFVTKDLEQAIDFYKLSAEQGYADSLVSAGEVCMNNKEYDRALKFFMSAYKNGDPVAAFYIGRMYYYGTGVEENDDKAFFYLKIASDKNIKDANAILGAMYGFGMGTEKDIDKAMQLLNDVTEGNEAFSYNMKGRIMIGEGNNEEGKKWLQKSAELGNEDAQRLLSEGVGKTDEELANEGADPYAMIRYSAKLMSSQKPDIHKALEVLSRANQLFPDNVDVKEKYANMLFLHGHVERKIGATQQAYGTLRQCINEIDLLRSKSCNIEHLNSLEIDACMEYGELAFAAKNYELALSMFKRTSWDKYPYAAVMTVSIHMDNSQQFGNDIEKETSFLVRATSSDKWREPTELADAYFTLSVIYSTGISNHIKADVNYAYVCIQKCADIDPELAKSELKKYTKHLFGNITYKP